MGYKVNNTGNSLIQQFAWTIFMAVSRRRLTDPAQSTIILAEDQGFEPRLVAQTAVFKTAAIAISANLPEFW